MSTTTHRLRKQTVEVGEDLEELGAIAKEAAHEKVDELRDEAAECCARQQRKLSDRVASIERYVRDRPFRSLLVAASIGLLLGRVWKRR